MASDFGSQRVCILSIEDFGFGLGSNAWDLGEEGTGFRILGSDFGAYLEGQGT